MPTCRNAVARVSRGSLTLREENYGRHPRYEATYDAIRDYLDLIGSDQDTSAAHLLGTKEIEELEGKLKSFYGMRYAVAVANATLGLLAVALALDLSEAEFITTPYTYGATLSSWLLLRNRPIFADVDPVTLTLHPESARRCVSRRTRALLAVDIYGVPCDSAGLRSVADEHGLWYIADAAQSLGATNHGEPASARADALVVSFTTGKPLFAGEGGAILTNKEGLYRRLLWHCQHPYRQRRELGLHLCNEFSLNARIHPLAAIWANAIFDESLFRLRRNQQRCLRVIDALNEIGLTETIRFRDEQRYPSFFRLTAAWKKSQSGAPLTKELSRRGFVLRIADSPIGLIYKNPSFLAQYRSLLTSPPICLRAEDQVKRRFCLAQGDSP